MPKNKKIDWAGLWLHALFGAVVGAVMGLWVWLRPRWGLYDSSFAGMVCVGGGALVVGIIAGLVRERFWDDLMR